MKYYYVYKVINKLNNKWYIGKRVSKDPYTDRYMGSGKLIKEAISKHGKENFQKNIIAVFNTNEEAALLEAKLVTKQSISTDMSYNMHEGGHGGFAHLNDGSDMHLARAREAGRKSAVKAKNHPNWGYLRFKKGDDRTRVLSRIANEKKKAIAEQRSLEETLAVKERYRQMALRREESKRQSGYYLNRKKAI